MIYDYEQCLRCRHFKDGSCDAFDGAIPYEIASGEHDHRQPFAGDRGIRFEAMPGKRHPLDQFQEDTDVRPADETRRGDQP